MERSSGELASEWLQSCYYIPFIQKERIVPKAPLVPLEIRIESYRALALPATRDFTLSRGDPPVPEIPLNRS